MKKVVILALGAVLFAAPAFAAITNSAHDFVNGSWSANSGVTEICIPCHTPHNAIRNDDILWNRGDTGVTFTVYAGSGTLDASDVSSPTGPSQMCFSCHDGVIAVDNFGGAAAATNVITGTAVLDGDLRDDHPVAFTYNPALATADGELTTPTNTAVAGVTGAISTNNYPLFGVGFDQFECSTCHDVHNAAGLSFLLNGNIAGSELCLDCHTK